MMPFGGRGCFLVRRDEGRSPQPRRLGETIHQRGDATMFLKINRSFLFGLALSLSPAAAGFLGVSVALGSAGGGGAVGPRTHDCPENRVDTRRDAWYARRDLEFAMYAIALKLAVWVLGAAAVVFLSFGAARLVAKESGNALRVGGGASISASSSRSRPCRLIFSSETSRSTGFISKT